MATKSPYEKSKPTALERAFQQLAGARARGTTRKR
jgi:hypothetical protein